MKTPKKDNKHTYYYCVERFYDGEPLHIGGYIMAEDEEAAIRKVIAREAFEEGCSYEILELREII